MEDYDFALIGLDGVDVPIAGPFDHALGALRLLSQTLVDEFEGDARAVIQVNEAALRATLVVFSNTFDGLSVLSLVLLPMPALEVGRESLLALTDLGQWEVEMSDFIGSGRPAH